MALTGIVLLSLEELRFEFSARVIFAFGAKNTMGFQSVEDWVFMEIFLSLFFLGGRDRILLFSTSEKLRKLTNEIF